MRSWLIGLVALVILLGGIGWVAYDKLFRREIRSTRTTSSSSNTVLSAMMRRTAYPT